MSRAVKCDFRQYNRQYTSPNEHFEYDNYSHSNVFIKGMKFYFLFLSLTN